MLTKVQFSPVILPLRPHPSILLTWKCPFLRLLLTRLLCLLSLTYFMRQYSTVHEPGGAQQSCNRWFKSSLQSPPRESSGLWPVTICIRLERPRGVRGADLSYTFYDFVLAQGVNTTLAPIMQRYLTSFAESLSPNAIDLPCFPPARPEMMVQNLGSTFIGSVQGILSCTIGVVSGKMRHIGGDIWN